MCIVNNFDYNADGLINWRDLINSLILIQSLPTNDDNIQDLCNQLPLDKENFMEAPAWFDELEINADNENALKFERAREIKRLIFEVNSFDSQISKECLGHALRKTIPLGEFLRNYV
mmetsp:Transcript_14568/g.2388  ORF Transcript_14568/g.2388 Transcript_14568/m.2388 type:complete len:117 (-) Transcript_14568:22-372(-)